ncbi:uncharacterized protein LOC111067772 isoform X2 [Drosophila obscura]|uniref:uncharacterized protein LOC111067772 isoform X2 n=1 Tax=Drosophila obscura TaxID=7282 RepID=UPI001BB25872|nr:uncharacterized protein LOC111067772 isoform X2 [Drosophila obscura]
MSNSVNALFLMALAFTTWCVSCYINAIEKNRRAEDFDVELYTEDPYLTSKQLSSENPASDVPRYTHTFEMMASFGIVLCLTYALVKVLKFVEARAMVLYWHSMEQEVFSAQQDNLILLNGQKKQQPSDRLELQTRGSGCSVPQVIGGSSLELQCSGSSGTNRRSNENDDSPNELSDREKDVCSGSTRGTHRVSKVPTATTSPSNTAIYINCSQLHIHGKMLNTEPINMDLVRESKLYARQPSAFLQVSDNFITGPRDRLMTAGSSFNVGLPPPYISAVDRPN